MPGAVIAFDQARPGPTTSYGSPGVARKDLWQSRVVTARSTTAGNTSYAWAFLDIPVGSAATLANADTANATFTPDLPGSYRLQLITNGGGPGNIQILIAAVTFDTDGVLTQRGWRIPAFGEVSSEDNFAGQLRGWSEAFEFILADIRTVLDTPAAGADTQVVFNDGGVLAGDAGFTYAKLTKSLAFDAAGYFNFGATGLPATGVLRFPGAIAAHNLLAWRNAGGTDDISGFARDAADYFYIGTDAAQTPAKQAVNILMFASANVAMGIGPQTYFSLGASSIAISVPEVVNQATAKGLGRSYEASLRTNDVGPHPLATYALETDTLSILDVEVIAVRADAALGVWWKKSKAHLNTTSVITQGTPRDVDTETVGGAAPTWTVAFDVTGTTARLLVDSMGDDVTWYIVQQGLRVLKT